ncbi:rCG46879 [Rattus norvegicus]|uniref:RCG46879 n=1 Tax=Rattus norvegicus TaxID=10116 RepID=A6IX00_RAT|nr:rCG46879 [Rattus norvegicus]
MSLRETPLHWLADCRCKQSEMLMQPPSADGLHTSVIHYCEAFRSQGSTWDLQIISSLYLVFTLRV